MSLTLEPLSQHRALTDWLCHEEAAVWDWYGMQEHEMSDAEEVRLSLLRDTYRLDEESHPEVFQEIQRACDALGIVTQVSAYQGQNQREANAAVCHLPGEAHVIFFGPILSLLNPAELRGVIGHELAHHDLWQREDGRFFRSDQILHAAASHPLAHTAHAQSARVWRLATELYADRGAFLAAGHLDDAVAGLVKISTGIAQVSAKSYLQQAREVFSKSKPKTDQLTHPDAFLRARALQLWVEQDPSLEETIERMLEAESDLDELNLLQQSQMTALTRRFVGHLLAPPWFQSDAVAAHARLFFQDWQPMTDETIIAELTLLPTAHREYFAQVMLDFCAVDPDLEDEPKRHCLELARDMECLGAFEKLLTRELKVKSKDVKKWKEKWV